MASAPTANQIKTQLVALLTPVIGTSLTKKAKILDYLPLAYLMEEGEDPTALRSSLDTSTTEGGATIKRVNCLMITELGFGQEPAQQDGTRHIAEARGRNLVSRRFGFAYAYQFGAGSEAVFSANIEVVRVTLNEEPKLGFASVTSGLAGQGAYIKNHSALQMQTMLPRPCSGVLCHVGEGLLTVNVVDPLGRL
jgi:hypothetical protein